MASNSKKTSISSTGAQGTPVHPVAGPQGTPTENPPFRFPGAESFIGYMSEDSLVANLSRAFKSNRGWAYRHFETADRFTDEVVYSTQSPLHTNPDAPLGGTGAGYPVFAPLRRP